MQKLSLEALHSALTEGTAAFRVSQRLQPAGGAGDKIFPPTYATGKDALRYAVEPRRLAGQEVSCVLVDSVASQANRMEDALQRAWDEDPEVPFPVISVDFGDLPEIADLDRITTLQAPHRVFDALLRDAVDSDGKLFRDTELGRRLTESSAKAATPLYEACPTVLVFGGWDSTGPRGGMGTKVQRALTSELIAVGAVTGKKTASRIDPAAIQANVDVFHLAADPNDYTIDPALAQKDKKGVPIPFSRSGGDGKKGKASSVNHSNVAPSIDDKAGGITCDYVQQTTVLSLPALRRLRFPTTVDGKALAGGERITAERWARTALAALGLAALACARSDGYDLRSRCALVPEGPLVLEAIPSEGGEVVSYALDRSTALALLKSAHAQAKEHGFAWTREPAAMKPAPKLAALIQRSRELAAQSGEEE